MEVVNEYFKKHADKVVFIELKDDTKINIEKHSIESNVPLPILTEELIDEIREGNLEEEVNITNIIEGIIYLMGVDKDFPYIKEYINILNAYDDDIEDYIFYKGIRFMDKEDYTNGAIYFRALRLLNPKNLNSIFNYALCLETIGNEFLSLEKEKEAVEFINESTSELEYILDRDENYVLVYYKLGYHYKYFEQNLKAKLVWNRYLKLDKDELRLQEIRQELDSIENNVLLETGITYLYSNQSEKALDSFLKLLPELKNWWEINYLIGLAYKGLNDYENAIDYFENALKNNKLESDVYNDLGISYFYLGNIEKAIEVFNDGIKNIKDDYKLFFNKGLGYMEQGKVKDAYRDISRAVELNPNDENIILQKQRIEEVLKEN